MVAVPMDARRGRWVLYSWSYGQLQCSAKSPTLVFCKSSQCVLLTAEPPLHSLVVNNECQLSAK